jgi:hypothetical protein
MDTQAFLDHVDELTDLELAVLLSLVAQHHCLIEADDDFMDDVASELALVRAPALTPRTGAAADGYRLSETSFGSRTSFSINSPCSRSTTLWRPSWTTTATKRVLRTSPPMNSRASVTHSSSTTEC